MEQRWRIGWTELAIGCSCPSSERPVCAEVDICKAIANGGCQLYDSLTNLPNQVLFQKRLEDAALLVRQGRAMVAVLCVDLDRFEDVNRRFGAAADRLIEACARRLRASLGEQDVLARLDGNEFAVLQLVGQPPQQVDTLCQRLLATLAAPYDLDGREVVVTASIGVALMPPGEHHPEQTLRHARIALCQAKSEGRATWRWFEPEPDAGAAAAQLTDDDLCAALLDDQFELHYQPRLEAASRRRVGVEALVRWRHPTRGLLAPDAFVPLAETDRPFLYGVDGTPQAEVLLRALIGLGQSLGIQTCVAGIETAEQAAWLCRQGCHELQGSYFADPVPAAELTRLVAGASDPVTASA